MDVNVEKTKVMRISRQPFPVKIMVDEKQLENVGSFQYFGSILTCDGGCTCVINVGLLWLQLHSTRRGFFLLALCYVWSIAFYGAETGTLRVVDQKYLTTFEMLCWRRMGKIR